MPAVTHDPPIPAHVGIIMDGNGRWARERGLPRSEGHREGLNVAKRIVKAAEDLGVRYLSLYTFSTENWKRAEDEVGFLMGLIRRHLSAEFDFYRENRVKVIHSGDATGLPKDVAKEIEKAMAETSSFDGITVNLAINYGGRNEIARAAVRAIAAGVELDEAAISAHMDHPELPDPDLVIRTAGEMRLSNFLLWESAYSELWFSQKYWPDFTAVDLREAVLSYGGRERRFGGRS